MRSIILIGGGGHCKSCIDVIELEGKYRIEGIVDRKEKISQEVLGYKIIASDENLSELAKEYKYFHITIGQIGLPGIRSKIFEQLKSLNVELPVIISPKAHVSKHSVIGEGSIIMHYALINSDAMIGKNCIINTRALIEHDSIVEDYCHIATGAIINGNSKIGKNSFIGSGAVTKQGVIIPENSFVKANSIFR